METELILALLAVTNALTAYLTNKPIYKHNEERKKQLEQENNTQTNQLIQRLNDLTNQIDRLNKKTP